MKRRDFLKLLSLGFSAAACRYLSLPLKLDATSTLIPSLTPVPGQGGTATPFEPATHLEPTPDATTTPEPAPTESPTVTATSLIPLFVIDGHQDIAWNALEFGRDPRKSAYLVRQEEAGSALPGLIGERTTGLPEYLVGRVGIIFATIFVMPASSAYPGYYATTYSTPKQAEARAREQLDYYHRLAEQDAQLQLVRSLGDLEMVLSSWAGPQPVVGLVISMEGADAIRSPGDLGDWYQAGLRLVGLAWQGTRYSGGTSEPGPLTAMGWDLLAAMGELNMVLDLSHMAEAAYLEAVDNYPGIMIASHSNPRLFLPWDRGLSDEMIRKLIARHGVVGVVLYNRYLQPGWVRGNSRQAVTFETVANVIDHVAQLAGDAQHVALGSDFDGGFGVDSIPYEMDSVADLIEIAGTLQGRGYSDEDIRAVLFGNWLRVLRGSLPA